MYDMSLCVQSIYAWFYCVWFVVKWLHMSKLSIFFRVTSLSLGQSHDCPSASEATLKNMGKINKYHITARDKKIQTLMVSQYRNFFRITGSFCRESTHVFSSQRACDMDLMWLLCCWTQQAFQPTVKFPLIWDKLTTMGHHSSGM